MKRAPIVLSALLLVGCPTEGGPDASACDLDVSVGAMETGSFVELGEGDPVELLLGFQGFRMLRFGVRARGASADEADISAFLSVPESGVELDQRSRERMPTSEPDGFLVNEYLLFINDHPPALLVGYEAELEFGVRAGGCFGGTRMMVVVRDDDPCVDHGIVLDAATRPDAPDGGVVCD